MSTHNITRCDREGCGQDMAEGSRRFVVSLTVEGMNGEQKRASFSGDLCSAACCSAVMNDLVRQVS